MASFAPLQTPTTCPFRRRFLSSDQNPLTGYTGTFRRTSEDKLVVKLIKADDGGCAELSLIERFRDDPSLCQDIRNIIIRLIEAVEVFDGGIRLLALVFPLVTPVPSAGPTQAQLAGFRTSLVKAVELLHEHGFAHHDIKPANLGVNAGATGTPAAYRLVLLDLGLMVHCSDRPKGATGYRGTAGFLPAGYMRKSWRGWSPFALDDHAVSVTLRQMGAKATGATAADFCGATNADFRRSYISVAAE
ncbi:hypothetical protein HK405_011828 [Cladochytrium tenue]|nr:hypothetical protein HK405_011828 [Cladochytrium tenue]